MKTVKWKQRTRQKAELTMGGLKKKNVAYVIVVQLWPWIQNLLTLQCKTGRTWNMSDQIEYQVSKWLKLQKNESIFWPCTLTEMLQKPHPIDIQHLVYVTTTDKKIAIALIKKEQSCISCLCANSIKISMGGITVSFLWCLFKFTKKLRCSIIEILCFLFIWFVYLTGTTRSVLAVSQFAIG